MPQQQPVYFPGQGGAGMQVEPWYHEMDMIGIPGIAAMNGVAQQTAQVGSGPVGELEGATVHHPTPAGGQPSAAAAPADFLSGVGATIPQPVAGNTASLPSPGRMRVPPSSPAIPVFNPNSLPTPGGLGTPRAAGPAGGAKSLPASAPTAVRFGYQGLDSWDNSLSMATTFGIGPDEGAPAPDDSMFVPVSGETAECRKRRLACARQRRRRLSMKKRGRVGEEAKSSGEEPEGDEEGPAAERAKKPAPVAAEDAAAPLLSVDEGEISTSPLVQVDSRPPSPVLRRVREYGKLAQGGRKAPTGKKSTLRTKQKGVPCSSPEREPELRLAEDDDAALPTRKRAKVSRVSTDAVARKEAARDSPSKGSPSPKDAVTVRPDAKSQAVSPKAGSPIAADRPADKIAAGDASETGRAKQAEVKPGVEGSMSGSEEEPAPLSETPDERKRRLARLRQRKRRLLKRSTKTESKDVGEPLPGNDPPVVETGRTLSSPLPERTLLGCVGWKDAGFASESEAKKCVDSAVGAVESLAGSGSKRTFVVHGCLEALAESVGVGLKVKSQSQAGLP